MPDADGSGRDHCRQSESTKHLNKLRAKQDVAAIFSIGNYAAKKRKKEYRDLPAECVQPEVYRRIGKPVDEPRLSDELHPGSDARGTGAQPHQPEIAVFECSENALEQKQELSTRRISVRAFDLSYGSRP